MAKSTAQVPVIKVDDKVMITGFGRYCFDFLSLGAGKVVEASQPHPYIPWRQAIKVQFKDGRHGYFFEGEYSHVKAV